MNRKFRFCGALILIVASTTFFGMDRGRQLAIKNGWNGRPTGFKRTVDQQSSNNTFISTNLPILVAAIGDGEVKNKMSQTCKSFNKLICKTNPSFVCMPTFTAREDMNDITLFFSWNNSAQVIINGVEERVIDLIGRKMFSDQISLGERNGRWSIGGHSCAWSDSFNLDYPNQLRTKYVEEDAPIDCIPGQHIYQLPCQTEEALLFALLCKDEKAVETLAPKIRAVHGDFPYYVRLQLHQDLFLRLINRDDAEAFELAAKYDPYNALNTYYPQDKTGDYDKPFLNQLMERRYILPKNKDKYVQIYRKCGGKTRDQLEPEKCIIS